jgi:hypothetical protein
MGRSRVLVNHPKARYSICNETDSEQQTGSERRTDASITDESAITTKHLRGMWETHSTKFCSLPRLFPEKLHCIID